MLRVDYSAMGRRIREQRHRLQITQAKLAEQMHVSQQYIGLLERGARIPSLETVITFCYVLDVPVEYLLQDSLPESLFTHYTTGSKNTLRSVMGSVRKTLTDLFFPPKRPDFFPENPPPAENPSAYFDYGVTITDLLGPIDRPTFLRPDLPACDEDLARIPFGYLDPPKPRRPRKKKPPKSSAGELDNSAAAAMDESAAQDESASQAAPSTQDIRDASARIDTSDSAKKRSRRKKRDCASSAE